MEYLENYITLLKYFRGKRSILEQEFKDYSPNANILFSQLINGLNFIHSKDIVHRDIKLDNILISDSLKIKYIDFINSTTRKNYDENLDVDIVGAYEYLSPKFLKIYWDGERNDFEIYIEANIFSLGFFFRIYN